MGALYKAPRLVWHLLCRQFAVTVEIDNHDPAFHWLRAYLGHVAATRYVTAATRFGDDVGPGDKPKPIFNLMPRGLCTFRFDGRRFLAWTSREALTHSIEHRETVWLQCWGRDAAVFKQLLEAAREFTLAQDGRRVTVYVPSGSGWMQTDKKGPRSRESLVLSPSAFAQVLDDAAAFLGRRAWYEQMGLPWRRGYLLHGPPGNGKSSLVHVLASELGTSVNVANLSHFADDAQMVACLGCVPRGHVLLLEDVDAAFDGRVARPGVKVTFAALLNALDGITAQDGRVLVMTTNHVEKLDAALIRPGRADVSVCIGNATMEQAAAMYRRFLPDDASGAAEFAASHTGHSMAYVQESLLQRRDAQSLQIARSA
jgi:chaperone BCS1